MEPVDYHSVKRICEAVYRTGTIYKFTSFTNFCEPKKHATHNSRFDFMFKLLNDHTKPLKVFITIHEFCIMENGVKNISLYKEIEQNIKSMMTDHPHNNIEIFEDCVVFYGSVEYLCKTLSILMLRFSDFSVSHRRKFKPIVYSIVFNNCKYENFLAFKAKYSDIIDSPYQEYIIPFPFTSYAKTISSTKMKFEDYSHGLYKTHIYDISEMEDCINRIEQLPWDVHYLRHDDYVTVFFDNLNQFFKFKLLFHDVPNLKLVLNPFKHQSEIDSIFKL